MEELRDTRERPPKPYSDRRTAPRPGSSDRRTAPRPEMQPAPPTFPEHAQVLPPGSDSPAFIQTLRWIFRPEAFMRRNAERSGAPFPVRLGPQAEVIFLSDPSSVRQVLQAPPEITKMGDINGLFRPILGVNSLLLLDGDEHLRQRKLLLPPVHGEDIPRPRDRGVPA